MHPYQERDGEEDRKQGGKTRVKDMESVRLEEEDVWERTNGKHFWPKLYIWRFFINARPPIFGNKLKHVIFPRTFTSLVQHWLNIVTLASEFSENINSPQDISHIYTAQPQTAPLLQGRDPLQTT